MFPKKNRVPKKSFDLLFDNLSKEKSLQMAFSGIFNFRYLKREENSSPQFSFIVPKSIVKKANKRNLLKRKGYLVLKKYLPLFPMGFIGIFIFNKKSLDFFKLNQKEKKNNLFFEKDIQKIIEKINLKEKNE